MNSTRKMCRMIADHGVSVRVAMVMLGCASLAVGTGEVPASAVWRSRLDR
jgi:hypothetical protein